MRVGRTLTHHFEIETRQYDLLGIDLGEGARRRMIIFGAVIVLVWVGLLVLIFGWPSKPTVSLYVVPPFVVTAFGWRPGRYHERRRRVTEWALAARYAMRSHRPVIALGARAADKSEYLRVSERIPVRRMAALAKGQKTPDWEAGGGDVTDPRHRAGASIALSQRARLLGTDHIHRVRRKTGYTAARGATRATGRGPDRPRPQDHTPERVQDQVQERASERVQDRVQDLVTHTEQTRADRGQQRPSDRQQAREHERGDGRGHRRGRHEAR